MGIAVGRAFCNRDTTTKKALSVLTIWKTEAHSTGLV